jgi:hypothetical protein
LNSLDARITNPIPNLESQSSEIGKFSIAKYLFVGGSDRLQSMTPRAQLALSKQEGEGQA